MFCLCFSYDMLQTAPSQHIKRHMTLFGSYLQIFHPFQNLHFLVQKCKRSANQRCDHASMIQCYTTVSDYYNSDLRTWTLSPSKVRVMRLESTTLGSLTGPGVLEQEHMKYLNWLGFLIVTRQKYCPKS